MSGHNGQLRALVERIERLEEEIAELNGDKSEVYKEAKSHGFDAKIIRKVVAARRKDPSERQEEDALFDMYMAAIEAPESLVRARVENIEEIPPHDPGTGEITDHQSHGLTSLGTEPAERSGDESSAAITTRPPLQAADDGQPSVPSSDADGAKMESDANRDPGRADAMSGHRSVKSEQPVDNSDPQEPPPLATAVAGEAVTSSHASPAIIPPPSYDDLEIPDFLRRTDGGYPKHGEVAS